MTIFNGNFKWQFLIIFNNFGQFWTILDSICNSCNVFFLLQFLEEKNRKKLKKKIEKLKQNCRPIFAATLFSPGSHLHQTLLLVAPIQSLPSLLCWVFCQFCCQILYFYHRFWCHLTFWQPLYFAQSWRITKKITTTAACACSKPRQLLRVHQYQKFYSSGSIRIQKQCRFPWLYQISKTMSVPFLEHGI